MQCATLHPNEVETDNSVATTPTVTDVDQNDKETLGNPTTEVDAVFQELGLGINERS